MNKVLKRIEHELKVITEDPPKIVVQDPIAKIICIYGMEQYWDQRITPVEEYLN